METRGTQQGVREGREGLVSRDGRPRRARLRRGERMVVIAHRLLTHPYQLFPLSTFMELLGAAKSTISEDLGFLRQAFDRFHLGKVETLAGAGGGGRYLAATARAFNVPMVTIRRGGRVTEGPSVTVNYVSGSSRLVGQMTLPLRAIQPGAKAIFIDDFLRGGGTARGVVDLMKEFRAELIGIGVLIETGVPKEKMAERYLSLIVYEGTNEHGEVLVYPSRVASRSPSYRPAF